LDAPSAPPLSLALRSCQHEIFVGHGVKKLKG
jgi:hypothetical protein